jgi:DNA-directed RNA polymerase subunit RPC12/RpoP
MPEIVTCPDCGQETYAGLPECPHCSQAEKKLTVLNEDKTELAPRLITGKGSLQKYYCAECGYEATKDEFTQIESGEFFRCPECNHDYFSLGEP